MTETVVMTQGTRILFAIPWGERTVLGTTDTDYDGPLDRVVADTSDTDYVLRIANQFFPQARLTNADIISTWAGLRPLIADKKGKPSDISRSHQIKSPEPNWWDVAGGKLTTCRLMAEQTVDRVIASAQLRANVCTTAGEPLLTANETEGISSITPPEFHQHIVKHFCENEWTLHLDDLMIRRTSWHYYHTNAATMAEEASRWMMQFLGWDEARRLAEMQRYVSKSA